MAPQTVRLPTLALDVNQVVRLLRASSYAQLMQSRTRVDWVPEPGAIQNVYGALFGLFGTPGTSEVVLPDMTRLEDEVRRMTARRIDVFFDKCALGPGPAGDYLRSMDEIRAYSLAAIRETVNDQLKLNRDIARAWGVSIEYLADVHLLSTLFVKVGGAVLPISPWVGIGCDFAMSTIPDLISPGKGKAIALAKEAVKTGAQEAAGLAGEKVVDAINRRSTENELQLAYRRLQDAEQKLGATIDRIVKRRQEVAGGFRPHRAEQALRQLEPRVDRYATQVDSAQKGLVRAGAVRTAAKGVSFIFLARDIMEAIEKHSQTVAAARE